MTVHPFAFEAHNSGYRKEPLVVVPLTLLVLPPWTSGEPKSHVGLASAYILQTGLLSRGTGGRWSDRAKAAYKSWRDYIIAVKGKIRLRVTLSTQSESAAFRRISLISSSGDL